MTRIALSSFVSLAVGAFGASFAWLFHAHPALVPCIGLLVAGICVAYLLDVFAAFALACGSAVALLCTVAVQVPAGYGIAYATFAVAAALAANAFATRCAETFGGTSPLAATALGISGLAFVAIVALPLPLGAFAFCVAAAVQTRLAMTGTPSRGEPLH